MIKQLPFKFNLRYFALTILLFGVEMIIAVYFRDPFIRPYVGDLLVVILIYCFWKSFINTAVTPTVTGILFFAFFVEWLQYINFIEIVGLHHSKLARTIIGYSFEWIDIIAYAFGGGIILLLEYLNRRIKRSYSVTR